MPHTVRMEQRRKYKIQPPSVWARVRQDYLAGLGAREVAARWDVGVEALRARATREGWSRYLQQPTRPVDGRGGAYGGSGIGAGDAAGDDGPDEGPDEGDGTDDAGEPDFQALSRLAARKSGRAMRRGKWADAKALAGLVEVYSRLGVVTDPVSQWTAETVPLQLLFNITFMERSVLDGRFAVEPETRRDCPLRDAYWTRREAEYRVGMAVSDMHLHRRAELERWVHALEGQLRAHGVALPPDTEKARRLRSGHDIRCSKGILTREEFEEVTDW